MKYLTWLFTGLSLGSLAGGLLTACTPAILGIQTTGSSTDSDRPDPSVQFTQEVTAVEPLISPELEALTQTTQNNSIFSDPYAQTAITTQLPQVNPLEIYDEFAIATTPTLAALNEYIYEQFIQKGYAGVVDTNTIPTNIAIQQFCQQSTLATITIDRAMTASEIEQCQASDRQPVGLAIGRDALILAVNQQANFVRGVTLGDLSTILTRSHWSEVNPDWPKEPLIRGLIGPESADVTLLANTFLAGNTLSLLKSRNTIFYHDTTPLIQALSITPYSAGIMSYSEYQRSPSTVRAV
ncbi:MAG: hypothetical protein F6K09_24985, partial [Merismopedia sp. SIO2A8]|nr:hypothetical protein [Merismopedia sp. SIO2A8]